MVNSADGGKEKDRGEKEGHSARTGGVYNRRTWLPFQRPYSRARVHAFAIKWHPPYVQQCALPFVRVLNQTVEDSL